MQRIQIDDGSKSYEIVNQNDKVLGVFTFNPSDTNIVEKYNGIVDELKDALKEVDTGNEEAIKAASSAIREKMDELFGDEMSKSFFTITGPLTPLKNGQLFVENVLEAIGGIIETEMKVRVKKVRDRMNTYTDKYNK